MIREKTRLCWHREKTKYGDCKQLHSSLIPQSLGSMRDYIQLFIPSNGRGLESPIASSGVKAQWSPQPTERLAVHSQHSPTWKDLLHELGSGCRLAAAAKTKLLKCQLVWVCDCWDCCVQASPQPCAQKDWRRGSQSLATDILHDINNTS